MGDICYLENIRKTGHPFISRTEKQAIAHFTVKGGNEAAVDLALVHSFLFYYVNHIFFLC